MLLGIQQAGFKTEAAVEMMPSACETLRANHESLCVVESKVQDFLWEKHPLIGVDLLSGGVPCQPFSNSGLHKGAADPRDGFPHFLKVIDALQPASFIIENVKGLLSSAHQVYFESVLQDLKQAGYQVTYRLLNAADYGVPQIRQRVFIVGLKNKAAADKFQWPEPTHSLAALVKAKYVDLSYWTEHGIDPRTEKTRLEKGPKAQSSNDTLARWRTVRDVVAAPVGTSVKNTETSAPTASELRPNWLKKHPVCNLDLPSHTIRARKNGETPLVQFPENTPIRRLTPRECARIQGYPDSYQFKGTKNSWILQIGNSAPPALVAAVASSVQIALTPNSSD